MVIERLSCVLCVPAVAIRANNRFISASQKSRLQYSRIDSVVIIEKQIVSPSRLDHQSDGPGYVRRSQRRFSTELRVGLNNERTRSVVKPSINGHASPGRYDVWLTASGWIIGSVTLDWAGHAVS